MNAPASDSLTEPLLTRQDRDGIVTLCLTGESDPDGVQVNTLRGILLQVGSAVGFATAGGTMGWITSIFIRQQERNSFRNRRRREARTLAYADAPPLKRIQMKETSLDDLRARRAGTIDINRRIAS